MAASVPLPSIAEQSPDAILIYTDGRVSYANAAAVALLRAGTVARLIGVEALALVHPDDRERVGERLARVRQGKSNPRTEQRFLRADGSIVEVEVTSAPFRYDGREAVQVFVRDITERKDANRRIGRLTDLYAALSLTSRAITRARDPVALLRECCVLAVRHGGLRATWVVRADFEAARAVRVATSASDQSYEEITISLDPAEPQGRGPTAQAIRNDCSRICNDLLADASMAPWHEAARRNGLRAVASFPLHRGGCVWGAIIHYAGETGFFRSDLVDLLERMAEDISYALDSLETETRRAAVEEALRQQERRIETLMGNLPGMAYRCRNDARWTMDLVSEGCLELTGYHVGELLFNQAVSFEDVIHPQDRVRVRRDVDAALGPQQRFTVEYRIVCKDGTEKWVWERGQGVRDAGGNLVAVEGFITDITERRRAHESLSKSEERFKSLVQLSSDWYWEQDENLRFTEVSSSFFRLSKPAEFLGKARWEIDGALPPAEGWAAHRRQLERHEPFRDFEYRRILHDGIHHFSFSGEPMFDERGAFRGYRGIGSDITARRNIETELVRFRAALEASADAIFITDFDSMRYLDVNETACRLLGYTREEMLGMGVQDVNPEADLAVIRKLFDEVRRGGEQAAGTGSDLRRLRRKDGQMVPVEVYRRYIRSGDADIVVSVARDVTERLLAEKALQLRKLAIEASVNAILITNNMLPDQPIEYVNPAFERITGYASAEVLGRNCRFLQAGDRDQPEIAQLRAAIAAGDESRVVLRNYRRNGDPFWAELSISPLRDESGRVTHFVGVMSDITASRNARDQLEHQASHDALTGLPNRSLLFDRLGQAIARAHRHGSQIAVAFVDLDNFKFINDSLGHGAGDEVLRVTAERLRSCVREEDTVARHGGDEFVLLLNDQNGRDSVTQVVSRVIEKLTHSIVADGQEIATTCSIGIGLYPQDANDAAGLLKSADAAMYRAKQQGKNSFRFYTGDMGTHLGERLKLETQLRRALEAEEFILHFQPRVDLRTGAIYGLEALIRWQHPQDGLVSPGRFIGIAEETGLIVPIGEWVVRQACAQARAWREEGLPPMLLSVNISARQFKRGDLVQIVSRALSDTGMPAQNLELELTESLVMENAQEFIETLNALKRLGVCLSVDDFGTGYSSLSYLKRFPVDRLKIDQSFVRDIDSDADDAAIARAVIQLGHSLDLRVTAEGVETVEQLRFLRKHECDEAQGFLFSKPVEADLVADLLRRRPAFPMDD